MEHKKLLKIDDIRMDRFGRWILDDEQLQLIESAAMLEPVAGSGCGEYQGSCTINQSLNTFCFFGTNSTCGNTWCTGSYNSYCSNSYACGGTTNVTC